MTTHWVQSDWWFGHLFDFHEKGDDDLPVILSHTYINQRENPLTFQKVGERKPSTSAHLPRPRWLREPYLENGRVICFRGSRMLPPSYERIQVIFQALMWGHVVGEGGRG